MQIFGSRPRSAESDYRGGTWGSAAYTLSGDWLFIVFGDHWPSSLDIPSVLRLLYTMPGESSLWQAQLLWSRTHRIWGQRGPWQPPRAGGGGVGSWS